MTSSPSVRAEWALYGKRPGSSSDYGVIAAGVDGLKRALLDRIIVGFSPGNPPAPGLAGPAALPWVSFGAVAVEGRDFAVVLVREWSGLEDAAHRPIAFTRCFCMPFDALAGRAAGFADLYKAVETVELDWNVPDPFDAPPVGLPLRLATGPGHDPLAAMGESQAMTAAAAVLERPVALLRGPSAVDARLAVLDSVPALLPAGARRWLAASTWAESNAKHRFHLAFTQRPRENDRRVEPHGDIDPLPPGITLSYRAELDRLFRVKGDDAVVQYLGEQVSCREREPVVVLDRLTELDLPGAVVRAAHEGTLRPAQVRRLDELGRVGELREADHFLVFAADLAVATAEDLRTDAPLFARHWRPALDTELGRVAQGRLWAGSWPYDDLLTLSDLALDRRCLPELVSQLAPREDTQPQAERRATAARWIEALDSYPVGTQLAGVVVRHSGLAVAVLRHVLDRPDLAATWVRRLDEADAVNPAPTPWADIAGPFRIALLHERGDLDAAQLDALDRIDPEIVPGLAVYLSDRRPERAAGFFGEAYAKLKEVYRCARYPQFVDNWFASMERLVAEHSELRADWDVETLLADRLLRRPMLDSIFDGSQVQQGYVDAFVNASKTVVQGPEYVGALLAAVVAQLPSGWSEPPERFVAVLDLLRRVGEGRLGTRLTTDTVLDKVVDEIANNAALVSSREFTPWYAEIENHREELLGPLLRAQLTRLRRDEPLVTVAQRTSHALRAGSSSPQVVEALHRSAFRPAVDQIAPLVAAVAEDLRQNGLRPQDPPSAYEFGQALVHDLIAGGFGAEAGALARSQLPDVIVRQIYYHAVVLHAAVTSEDDAAVAGLHRQGRNLQAVQNLLAHTIEAVDRAARRGRGKLDSLRGMFGIETSTERHGRHR